MSTKENKPKESPYVTTLRSEKCPAIAATILRGNTMDGHSYLYFSIKRAWKSKSSQEFSYSDRFYTRHADGIKEVTDMAVEWIENNPQAADAPIPPAATGEKRFSVPAPSQTQ